MIPEAQVIFRTEKLAKAYGRVLALSGVSLQVSQGSILGLVGPNGAGKTTFLKSVIGLVRPDSGKIEIDGINAIAHPVRARKKIGFQPGESNLYGFMRAKNFLRFCLASYANIDRELLSELLEVFALPLTKKVRTYSTGMKKKLLLIQALCPDVPLILLDEPADSLDPTTRIYLNALLRRLAEKQRTIIFSSHQLEEIEKVCDSIAFLNQGKLLDWDTTKNIRKKAARLIRLTLADKVPEESLRFSGVEKVVRKGDLYLLHTNQEQGEILKKLSNLPLTSLEYNSFRLSELYSDLYEVN